MKDISCSLEKSKIICCKYAASVLSGNKIVAAAASD